MNEAIVLLKRYAQGHDEEAFRQIVARYFDFVHGVALRRLHGNGHDAVDVAQLVFTDLARKAADFGDDAQIGGWLHQHTCFTTSKFVRSEMRRAKREQQAAEMNAQESSSDVWSHIAPSVDDALNTLRDEDRVPIIMRFLEARDLRTVGACLGISDDAAQKRVSRALDKLREALRVQGVVVSSVSLGALLTANASPAVASPPIDLITASATSAPMVSGSLHPVVSRPMWQKLALPAAAIFLIGIVLVTAWFAAHYAGHEPLGGQAPALNESARAGEAPAPKEPSISAAASSASGSEVASQGAGPKSLVVHVIDAVTKRPIPRASVRISNGIPPQPETVFVAGDTLIVCDENGSALVPIIESKAQRLMLQFYAVDHADWISIWPKEDVIPAEHTVELQPGLPVGGRVVDEDGKPIAGAQVRLNPRFRGLVRSNQKMAIRPLTNITDSAGKWLDTHVPEANLDNFMIDVVHPDYTKAMLAGNSAMTGDSQMQDQLRARQLSIVLRKGLDVSGTITSQDGMAIADALVSYSYRLSARRIETTTDSAGRYTLRNIPRGQPDRENFIAVMASHFAVATKTFPHNNSEDLNFVLNPGATIRGRVLDAQGEPLADVRVGRTGEDDGINWIIVTESDGRFLWSEAPASPQTFDFAAPGFNDNRNVLLSPQAEDHVVVLHRPQVLRGTVKDAEDGKSVPRFYLAQGQEAKVRQPFLSEIEQEFSNGKFEIQLGNPSNNFVRIRAPGYLTAAFPISSDLTVAASLKRTSGIEGLVNSSKGRPVANAEIRIVSDDWAERALFGNRLLTKDEEASRTLSDELGRFKMSPGVAASSVIAVHPTEGYAELKSLKANGVNLIRLEPWARIEGTIFSNSIPVADQLVRILVHGPVQMELWAMRATTDVSGRFVFERIPPIGVNVNVNVKSQRGPRVDRSGPLPPQTNFTAVAGAVTYVELDAAKEFVPPERK